MQNRERKVLVLPPGVSSCRWPPEDRRSSPRSRQLSWTCFLKCPQALYCSLCIQGSSCVPPAFLTLTGMTGAQGAFVCSASLVLCSWWLLSSSESIFRHKVSGIGFALSLTPLKLCCVLSLPHSRLLFTRPDRRCPCFPVGGCARRSALGLWQALNRTENPANTGIFSKIKYPGDGF